MKGPTSERRELSVIHECAAEACTFNENHVCEAGEIDVMPTERGPVCATFTPDGNTAIESGHLHSDD